MPSPIFGPAVRVQASAAHVLIALMKLRISKVNISEWRGETIIVFRNRADCVRYCAVSGESIEADARYFARNTVKILD